MATFCNYFSIPLEDFLFKELSETSDTENKITTKNYIAGPINKCTNRTYYCYYIKESYNSKNQLDSRIACTELKILSALTPHSANVMIFFEKKQNSNEEIVFAGKLSMDESYAYIEIHDSNKDFFFEVTFYYHRRSMENKYKGGAGLVQRMDHHKLPISQLCVISQNAISSKLHNTLGKLLQFSLNEDKNMRLSRKIISSSAILRLTKQKDSEIFDWLRQNVGL